MKTRYRLLLFAMLMMHFATAQHSTDTYTPDPDTLVQHKLEDWQDLKFGLLMHWGTYSQWGIVESWSICPEDYGWCERTKGHNPGNYFDYVREYENLKTTFNPVQFDPQRWAKAAAAAGMKYMIFTTKHHDGFCMFNTKYTDYRITDDDCPFHTNPNANITRALFDAFRKENMWVGAYFSKPDWHCPDYWDPAFPPMDRNVNYDPLTYPDKWASYVQFTHNQIMELMSDYGPVDILWLDGGWVARKPYQDIEAYYDDTAHYSASGFMITKKVSQDIRMDELVRKARGKQPGLIVVDRAVAGKNQNYLTPENRVPGEALPYPWESCIIAGGGWSWVPDATYMSGREAVHLLVDIVAKGGNLLLNIAPGPQGQWHEGAYTMLQEIGEWMQVNSEAIYGTRAIAPYKSGNVCFTQKNHHTVYAICLTGDGEEMPATLQIEQIPQIHIKNVVLVGSDQKPAWKQQGTSLTIEIPEKARKAGTGNYTLTLRLDGDEK